jgi:DNA invertase Pin-like site-specific DNA recombinase
MNEDLKGKRVIIVARCSTDSQKEASIPRQMELGVEYAKRTGMIVVDKTSLEGKSASLREHVPQLRELIRRKQKHQDFDALWFLTLSRFDRSRSDGEELFREFEKAGVLIVTEKQGCFTGRYGWIKRGIALQEAQAYVEDLAIQTAGGRLRLIKEGILPHTQNFPFALDRLYLDAYNKKQFILRKTGRGRVERLDPTTGKVLGVMLISTANYRCRIISKGPVTK